MLHLSILLVVILMFLLSTVVTSTSAVPPEPPPICIVGSGLTGLSVGHLLQNMKNRSVIIFEKNDRVGGKISTFRTQRHHHGDNNNGDPVQIEMGPIVFSPSDNSFVQLVEKFNLTPIPFNNHISILFDPTTGALYPTPPPTKDVEETAQIFAAAQRYAHLHSEYLANHVLDFGFVETSKHSPELFLPLSHWLDEKGVGILKKVFKPLLISLGFGDLDQTAAVYSLKLIDPLFLFTVMGSNPNGSTLLTLAEGLDTLVSKMAEDLQIKLGEGVNQIRRHWTQSMVVVVTQKKTYMCKNVILAFPPLLPRVKSIVSDLHGKEREILNQIRIHKLVSAGHLVPKFFNETVYVNLGVHLNDHDLDFVGAGQAILFARQNHKVHPHTNVYSSYSWIRGSFEDLPSSNELAMIHQRLEGTIKAIFGKGDDMDRTNADVQSMIFPPSQNLDFFPHVTSSSMVNGFYKKFDKIQGTGGLYYATTLLGAEGMDSALKMSGDFVAKYFS